VRYLKKPVYESLPVAYFLLGALLLWMSYRQAEQWWSTPCGALGILGLVAGLMVWMRRRDYRATAEDYARRGRTVEDSADEQPP
jgi:hypothetical protein